MTTFNEIQEMTPEELNAYNRRLYGKLAARIAGSAAIIVGVHYAAKALESHLASKTSN